MGLSDELASTCSELCAEIGAMKVRSGGLRCGTGWPLSGRLAFESNTL